MEGCGPRQKDHDIGITVIVNPLLTIEESTKEVGIKFPASFFNVLNRNTF